MKDEIAQEIVSELRLIREELQNLTMAVRSLTRAEIPKIRIEGNHLNSTRDVLRIRLMCATLKGISHQRKVLNAASREANGIKMLQRTRDSSQKQLSRRCSSSKSHPRTGIT